MCKRYSGKEGILKIDFKHARGVFEDYLNGYDREDEKIKLKIIHTYGVVKSAREIGHRMHLNEEDQQLAELIALLHDIGRFQQLRLYNSFSQKDNTLSLIVKKISQICIQIIQTIVLLISQFISNIL